MLKAGELDEVLLRGMLAALEPIQADLSMAQLLALIRIALEPGLSVNELADRMQCPQQTASRHVAALLGRYETSSESQNTGRSQLDPLISQEISQTDPRRRALFISTQGRTLLKKTIAQIFSGAKK
jgi:DNA-binding MarR family transcriptional regulator